MHCPPPLRDDGAPLRYLESLTNLSLISHLIFYLTLAQPEPEPVAHVCAFLQRAVGAV